MKSMKKILSLVITLTMVLSIAPLAMAVAGDDGMGGMETFLIEKEDFQSPTVTVPEGKNEYEISPGASFNGWERNAATNVDFNFGIAKDGDNQFLSHWWGGTSANGARPIIKKLSKVVADRYIRLTYKFKHDGYNGFFYVSFGNQDSFIFNMNSNRFYPGKYQNNSGTFTFSMPKDKWHDIEMLFDFNEKKVYCYINGVLMNTPLPDYTFDHAANYDTAMGSFSSLQFGTLANNAGTSGKHVYVDDVALSTVDQKRICEIAAEKTTVPSATTGNITLPTTGFGGTTISWASSNANLISDSGVVTRPENGEIVPVTLTATITHGQTSVAFPYTVNVLPKSAYFYEDFEGASVGKLAGYNSWTEWENTSYTHAFTSQVIQETASNKAGMIWREANPTGSGTAGPAQYTVSRTFDNAIEGGIASVKMNVYFEDDVRMITSISDGVNSEIVQFQVDKETIYYSKTNTNLCTNVTMPLDVWNELEYRVNLPEKTLEIIFNGKSLYTIENITLTGVLGITLEENRTGLGGTTNTNEKFYFDNIVAELLDIPYAYGVVDFAFKDADGEASLYPKAGGSVSGVTIKKYKNAENATLIATVYDGGKLTKATSVDVTQALINAETIYPVNLPITDENTQIRVFTLDKETLVPLALDKTYEKRSPITVFIAGDSMAEVVKIDDGTLGYQREGWGMRIGEQLEGITVSNHAVGGRDTSEFISEGRLNSILAKGQRGDFVFVSFGHNDHGSDMTIEDYRANLAAYSQAIKEKGMTPIFVTSISRIDTGVDDSENWAAYDDELYTYAEAMVSEAAENSDVCLDLYTAFNNELSGMTYAEARAYYVPKTVDGTHLSTEGAQLAASLIAELLGESASTLKDLLK